MFTSWLNLEWGPKEPDTTEGLSLSSLEYIHHCYIHYLVNTPSPPLPFYHLHGFPTSFTKDLGSELFLSFFLNAGHRWRPRSPWESPISCGFFDPGTPCLQGFFFISSQHPIFPTVRFWTFNPGNSSIPEGIHSITYSLITNLNKERMCAFCSLLLPDVWNATPFWTKKWKWNDGENRVLNRGIQIPLHHPGLNIK